MKSLSIDLRMLRYGACLMYIPSSPDASFAVLQHILLMLRQFFENGPQSVRGCGHLSEDRRQFFGARILHFNIVPMDLEMTRDPPTIRAKTSDEGDNNESDEDENDDDENDDDENDDDEMDHNTFDPETVPFIDMAKTLSLPAESGLLYGKVELLNLTYGDSEIKWKILDVGHVEGISPGGRIRRWRPVLQMVQAMANLRGIERPG